ncbi:Inosine-5'-monophosphate dehydrogenase [Sphaceloma murrayae]|uniref:Inosine-5'-monophosphate dehydrogenase n=1 Tax=Sphaceloma murrayae TaxID=2082308 RepID=A0A2K1QWN5_9PEZI|nr:necrosis- and ethylene-inducing-like protein [Sphaceloma murrayae]PNS19468.1 Inosine-5'-monophosphate dehydrogenase [Sphaceloma murrayae]
MALKTILLALLAASTTALAAPVEKRAVIAHSAVVGFSQTVPNTALGQLYLRYQPFLQVQNGCVPFPAVDAQGNTGGGLNPSGEPSGGCSSSPGQVYARSGTYNGRFGIMYAWYFPKDSPASGLGHRHDWESVVVWLSSSTGTPSILGVSASAHGDFEKNTSPNLSGTNPLIRYYSTFPINHQLGYTSTRGGSQPLVAWESLPAAARTALTNTDFGSANVPLKDANFNNNLAEAF